MRSTGALWVRRASCPVLSRQEQVGKKFTRKQKGKLVMKQSRITSQYMKEGDEDEDEDGEKVEEEVLEEGEEEEGESDVVRELLSKHSVWLGM
jgi:hypothetical protein